MVGAERFELSTSCSQSRRSTRLSYTPKTNCSLGALPKSQRWFQPTHRLTSNTAALFGMEHSHGKRTCIDKDFLSNWRNPGCQKSRLRQLFKAPPHEKTKPCSRSHNRLHGGFAAYTARDHSEHQFCPVGQRYDHMEFHWNCFIMDQHCCQRSLVRSKYREQCNHRNSRQTVKQLQLRVLRH